MATIPLDPDFKDFLKYLTEESVEFLVIGGFAVNYHGYPRGTGDLDVWIATTPENKQRVVNALRRFGFSAETFREDIFARPNAVIRMGVPPLRIEIQTKLSGVEFSECFARRVMVNWDGLDLPVISLADLRANKQAAKRPKDLNDLEHLPEPA